MRVLILGGSHEHPGGVEAFCDRAEAALRERDGWQVDRAFTGTAYLGLARLPVFFATIRSLWRYRRQRPDCIWLQYHALPDLALLTFCKLLGMRVMVTPHLGANWRSQSNPALRWLSGIGLRSADLLALLSRTQEQEVNLPPNVPRALIRTFLPDGVLTGPLRDDGSVSTVMGIVHAGRLSEGKGSFLTIEICAALRDMGLPFAAEIIGSGDETTFAQLEALIAERDLVGRVVVKRWMPVDHLLDRMRAADVLIHPSRIDSYPLVVLEALASATLPVCLRLAGACDMVESYDGHIIGPDHPVEEAVAWLCAQDLADLRRRGRAAAALVRRDYAWDRCARLAEAALTTASGSGALALGTRA